jgi:light-regulated signal transduction histidine kinase (bacteriophytochrome)
VRKDGSRFWARVVMTALYDESGQVRGFAKVTRDVTERRLLEEQLRHSTAEATRSNTELEQFAYVASHDLQEPLRMVASYAQLLSRRYRGKLDQDADDFIGFAVDGATRMSALINALLEYARVGTQAKEPVPTDTAALVDQVIADYGVLMQEHSARITRGDLPTVLGDPLQLRFSVRDNGVGIDPQYADRIFVIFQRLHGQAEQPGTGLGLAICKEIV